MTLVTRAAFIPNDSPVIDGEIGESKPLRVRKHPARHQASLITDMKQTAGDIATAIKTAAAWLSESYRASTGRIKCKRAQPTTNEWFAPVNAQPVTRMVRTRLANGFTPVRRGCTYRLRRVQPEPTTNEWFAPVFSIPSL